MSASVNFIMLLDDDEATNFFHRIMVEEADVTNEIIVQNHAEDAVIVLQAALKRDEVKQAILFLDINMPVMDGWMTLDAIAAFDLNILNKLKIVMVSASEYPRDLERMKAHPLVDAHMPKPLESDRIKNYVSQL